MSLKSLTVAALVAGGAIALIGPVSAAPIGAGAASAGALGAAPAEHVQYGYGYGYGRPAYGYGPGPGPGRGYYGRRRYGPPVVCRVRPSPYGPREVCFRRY